MSGVGSIPGLQNGNPVVFFDITIGGHAAGRIKMEVRGFSWWTPCGPHRPTRSSLSPLPLRL